MGTRLTKLESARSAALFAAHGEGRGKG